jgi:hypothetical protein
MNDLDSLKQMLTKANFVYDIRISQDDIVIDLDKKENGVEKEEKFDISAGMWFSFTPDGDFTDLGNYVYAPQS